jgi:ABC-type iron transport system FetAB ATPase subunit
VKELTATFDTLMSSVKKTEGRRDSAERRVSETETRIAELETEESLLARVADLFRTLIDGEVIANVKTAESLITEGLSTIFDDMNISVRTEVDVQRGKVSVDLITVQQHPDGTVTEGASTDAYGGSVSTVQSVLMRVVVVSRRGLKPILLLDESLGAVAEHYVPRVGRFLALLCDKMGMDVLAVTHNPALVEAASTAYRIQNQGGEATFKRIRTGV